VKLQNRDIAGATIREVAWKEHEELLRQKWKKNKAEQQKIRTELKNLQNEQAIKSVWQKNSISHECNPFSTKILRSNSAIYSNLIV
jgi:hypothetical protein